MATAAAAVTPNYRVRDQLITEHVEMALRMAQRMARRTPPTVLREDIESAALLGLTEAANRYDVGRAEPFMAFAAKRVRGAILDYLRRSDFLTRRGRQQARKLSGTTQKLEAKLGRKVSDDEVAQALGVSEADFHGHFVHLRRPQLLNFDEFTADTLGAPGETAKERADRQQLKATLMEAFEALSERELTVLSCYYQQGFTLREIGETLGVTESRVCQIHTHALKTLREHLSN